jgi:ABC-2 type transport system permease protein
VNFARILQIARKESIQALRDPRMRTVVFLAPLVQLLLFGYAVTTDVRNVPMAVLDLDGTPTSRRLVARFAGTRQFRLAAHVRAPADLRAMLDRGEADLALHFAPGFEGRVLSGRAAPLQILVDGTNSNRAGIILDYAEDILNDFSRELVTDRRLRSTGAARWPEGIVLDSRAWYNQNLESRNFYVPGVIAIVITLQSLLLTGMAVVREKELGTIEQIMVSPVRPGEFILGKTIPFAGVAAVNVLIVVGAGVAVFGVPLRGSLALLFGATALHLLSALGAGLLISSICTTQQQAMMTTFLFYFPATLLSGFVFPIANMPPVVRALTWLNPMRYYLTIVRGIFLKGVGLDLLWPQMAVLALMGVATLWLASRQFRKTLA